MSRPAEPDLPVWFRLLALLLIPSIGSALPLLEPDPGWPAAGVTIAARMVGPGSLQAVPDGAGGLVLAWVDARKTAPGGCNCHDTGDLWAQRLDAAGAPLWSRTDVGICTWGGIWGGGELLAAVEPLPDGGAVVAWIHGDGPSGTFAQRLGPDGALRWGAEGATAFTHSMGYKWVGRTAADPGGGLWFGLDAAAETGVRIGRCVPGDRGPDCGVTVAVALSGTLQALTMLPGDRPGRALIVAAVSRAGVSRIDAIPLAAGPDGRIVARPAVAVETIRAARVPLVAVADGAGGAVLGWTAPSGTGFEFMLRALRPDGRTRWTRHAGPVAGAAAPFALAPDTAGAIAAWAPGPGVPLAVESLDGRGRPGWRRTAGRSPRAERLPAVAPSPAGPLLAWIEWEGGERESLRAAVLGPAGAAGATIPVEAGPLLVSDGRITIERIAEPAPGRTVLLVHDGGTKALRALGLQTR